MVRESCVMGPSADLSERLEVTALMSFALGALYHFYELFLLLFLRGVYQFIEASYS